MFRFFYVKRQDSDVVHMDFVATWRKSPVEGDLLACGRILPALNWLRVRTRSPGVRVCRGCLARVPAGISVARVR